MVKLHIPDTKEYIWYDEQVGRYSVKFATAGIMQNILLIFLLWQMSFCYKVVGFMRKS